MNQYEIRDNARKAESIAKRIEEVDWIISRMAGGLSWSYSIKIKSSSQDFRGFDAHLSNVLPGESYAEMKRVILIGLKVRRKSLKDQARRIFK